jgi:hypothetical protein
MEAFQTLCRGGGDRDLLCELTSRVQPRLLCAYGVSGIVVVASVRRVDTSIECGMCTEEDSSFRRGTKHAVEGCPPPTGLTSAWISAPARVLDQRMRKPSVAQASNATALSKIRPQTS